MKETVYVFIILFLSAGLLLPMACVQRGYKVFSTTNPRLPFTFEYPASWRLKPIEQYQDLARVRVDGPLDEGGENYTVMASFKALRVSGENIEEEARKEKQGALQFFETRHDFRFLKDGFVDLGGVQGYDLQVTFDVVDFSESPLECSRTGENCVYIPARARSISVGYKGVVYLIDIFAYQRNWDRFSEEIDHLVDTFRFLD